MRPKRPDVRAATSDEELLCVLPELLKFNHVEVARIERMAREITEGFAALSVVSKGVSVFGSTRTSRRHQDYRLAREVGMRFGREGFAVITGGGPGIMEAANRGAQDAGALSIGLNIELPRVQVPNPYLNISLDFRYFFVRKLMFIRYASAFVFFPGGFGTLDELFESLTLVQTGKVRHFPVVLFDGAYWDDLLRWMDDRAVRRGLVLPVERELMITTDDPSEVVEIVKRGHSLQAEALSA